MEENNNNNNQTNNENIEQTGTNNNVENSESNKQNKNEKTRPKDNKKANIICLISLILQYVPVLLQISIGINSDIYKKFVYICLLVSFILMIVVRVKYRKNKFGLILMILYIINIIATIILFALALFTCHQALNIFNTDDFNGIFDCIHGIAING